MTNAPASPDTTMPRVREWEYRTGWPLFAGAVVFMALMTWMWVDENHRPEATAVAAAVQVVLWLWFIVDYLIRLRLARGERGVFFRSRGFDLASIILPFLRPFLVLVYIWRLPVFRHGGQARQRVRYAVTTVVFALLYVYTCSYGVWLVERHAPNASIVNFGDAIWWGFTTIATVGYGDFAPVTVPGRILAVGLMAGGVVVIGVVVATLISDLNERIRTAAHINRRHEPPESGVNR